MGCVVNNSVSDKWINFREATGCPFDKSAPGSHSYYFSLNSNILIFFLNQFILLIFLCFRANVYVAIIYMLV